LLLREALYPSASAGIGIREANTGVHGKRFACSCHSSLFLVRLLLLVVIRLLKSNGVMIVQLVCPRAKWPDIYTIELGSVNARPIGYWPEKQ